MTLDELLRYGRRRVARRWAQGEDALDPKRGYCATSALINGHESPMCEAIIALTNAAGVAGGPELTDWNDAPERTQADVLALYDRALAGVRE